MSFFKVDVLTPSKVLIKNMEADSLFVPTVKGQINILENHTHIIEKLDTGILTIIKDKKETYITITTGIVKVLNDVVTILSTVSEIPEQIDLERSEKALSRAKQKLQNTDGVDDLVIENYRRKIARAEMRIKLASQYQ